MDSNFANIIMAVVSRYNANVLYNTQNIHIKIFYGGRTNTFINHCTYILHSLNVSFTWNETVTRESSRYSYERG